VRGCISIVIRTHAQLAATNKHLLMAERDCNEIMMLELEKYDGNERFLTYKAGENWDLVALCGDKEYPLALLFRERGTTRCRVDGLSPKLK